MKRRGFLKFLGAIAAVPFLAPVAENCLKAEQSKKIMALDKFEDWPTNAKEHLLESIRAMPIPTAFNPSLSTISYAEYADAGRMPTYEGFVPSAEGNRLWRFDVTHELTFKCRNCDLVLPFNRDDFRQHGQKCNAVFGEQS